MITHRQRHMLLWALSLIDQACQESAEIETAIGDSVWLELSNFIDPLPPMTEAVRQHLQSLLPDKIYLSPEDEEALARLRSTAEIVPLKRGE
jgi:hypothetical protein